MSRDRKRLSRKLSSPHRFAIWLICFYFSFFSVRYFGFGLRAGRRGREIRYSQKLFFRAQKAIKLFPKCDSNFFFSSKWPFCMADALTKNNGWIIFWPFLLETGNSMLGWIIVCGWQKRSDKMQSADSRKYETIEKICCSSFFCLIIQL